MTKSTETWRIDLWFRDKKLAQSGAFGSGALYFAAVFMLVFILADLTAKPVWAQEFVPTEVTVETRRGFGRLAIELPDRTKFVDYEISTDDNVLVVLLAEPLEIDLEKEVRALEDFILIARHDPEKTALRFALSDGVRVNTMVAGEHLFLDFLPREWRGENPAIPEEVIRKLERRAEEALVLAEENKIAKKVNGIVSKLSVRLGRHPTFTRFVFSWNVPYKTEFKRDGNRAILSFNRYDEYNTGPVNADLPALVKKVKTTNKKKRTTIELTLEKSARVRSYLDGDDYIVDITNDDLTSRDNGSVSLPFLIGGLPEIPENAQDVTQSTLDDGERAVVAVVEKKTKSVDDLKGRAKTDEKASSSQVDKGSEDQKLAVSKTTDDSGGNRLSDNEQPSTASDSPEYVDPEHKKVRGLSTVEAGINAAKDSLRLVFPFAEETPASIFRRGKSVWMVFKTEDIIDISALETLDGDFVRKLNLFTVGDYRALRIGLPSARLASAAIDENNWIISIGNAVIRPSEPLGVERAIDEDGNLHLRLPLKDAAGQVVLDDPVVGDKIHAVVASPPARGLPRQYRFLMFNILPSTQAFAFVPVTDDIKAKLYPDRVTIFSKKSLRLSPFKNLRETSAGTFRTEEWYDAPLDFKQAERVSLGDFFNVEHKLINEILTADKNQKPRAQVDLAKFYLANGYGPEGLAKLDQALFELPELENKRLFVLAKGVAEIIIERFGDALKTLSGESLSKDQDAAIWRTIAAAHAGKWEKVLDNAALGRARLVSYNVETQQSFFLAAADAALHQNDLNSAKTYLANIVLRDAKDHHRGRYEILQGDLALAEGRFEDARFFYKRALKINDIRVMAHARLNLIELDIKAGSSDNSEIIEELERFTAVWRNDDLELRALRSLGQVLAKEEKYRQAFELVRSASISNNNSEITHGLQDDMKELFISLFHGGKADTLEPIDALSLYYDFRHLMPIGRIGDEIVRYLARRLIDLDLLPQAAELLDHQVDKRLNGVARARVAADLAVVQLLDGKPHRAITTLHKSRSASLPVAVRRQRRLVEAYTLSEIGKVDQALELLTSLDGEDADRMRANIFWDGRRWKEAGELLEKTHSGRWNDVEPLDVNVRLDLMRAAIAHALAKDDFALNRLNQKYGQKMAESPDASIFSILTKPLDDFGFDRDVAVDSILNIGTRDSFLRDYRQRYLTSRPVVSGA